ncbi:hypothetical protein EVAR_51853_1 [Eumeta japonica]|uniref:Uncharacterized protein n=1 Tax=Eumeta variegata TaxID=151549 RepID=A0A4C1YT67_EUMVA|nr:hypothetical protein EVAR_51853_1 [Eumeta japonica]
MTKKQPVKRKVDECRDKHPESGFSRGDGVRGERSAANGHWGERAVLRPGKKSRCDPIPSVIGIIQYTVAHPLCRREPSAGAVRRARVRAVQGVRRKRGAAGGRGSRAMSGGARPAAGAARR